jgi:hypothetical protein
MPQPETRAWWSDVQHVRDSIERKREREAHRTLRLDARAAARAVAERDAAPSQPGEIPSGVHDLEQSDDFEWATRPGRRFDRAAPDRRDRSAPEHLDRSAPEHLDRSALEHGDRSTPQRRGRFARADRTPPAQPNPLAPPARRRTVEITGHPGAGPTLPRLVEIDRRRPARRAVERVGPRPDRIALWAVVLGFFLILVAVTSTSHAATRATSARPSVGHTAHSQVVRAHTATLRANPPAR